MTNLQVLYGMESANRGLLEEVNVERELLVELLKHYNRVGKKTARIVNMLTLVEKDIDWYVRELYLIQEKISLEIERGWEITEGK